MIEGTCVFAYMVVYNFMFVFLHSCLYAFMSVCTQSLNSTIRMEPFLECKSKQGNVVSDRILLMIIWQYGSSMVVVSLI